MQFAAAAHGLGCEVILEERTGSKAIDYTRNGNVLMDRLFGAGIRTVPGGSDMPAELEKTAAEVTARGGRPYIIPGGGSNPVGALGYVDCAREIVVQADELDMQIDRIVTATGSAGTHAGLVAGLAVMGADIPVLGIGVRAPKEKQEENVLKLARETATLLGRPGAVTPEMVVADCDYVGAGYGLVDDAVVEALKLAARTDAIVLDPVYTGKAMKGLIDHAAGHEHQRDVRIVADQLIELLACVGVAGEKGAVQIGGDEHVVLPVERWAVGVKVSGSPWWMCRDRGGRCQPVRRRSRWCAPWAGSASAARPAPACGAAARR